MLKKRRLRLTAALGAAVVALGIALPMPAYAAPTSVVDVNEPTSLTIYKFSGTSNIKHDGSEITTPLAAGNLPLEGASFTVVPIGQKGTAAERIDLTSNAGWASLQDLAAAVGPNPTEQAIKDKGYSMGAGAERLTKAATIGGDAGQQPDYAAARFADLPVGAYYVYESVTPEGYQSVDPFIVTVPMTNPNDATKWMYDIFVYPKNAKGGEKIPLDTETAKVGDALSWEINATVPTMPNGKSLEAFVIRDVLDGKLDYVGTTVTAKNAANTNVTLVLNTHYTITAVGPNPGGKTVDVTFTPAGRTLLEGIPGGKVTVVIDTKVNAAGNIENVADIFNNNDSLISGEGDVTTPPVLNKSAYLEIFKVDKDEPTKGLQGAKFELYWDNKPTFTGTAKRVLDGASQPVMATTGANGKIIFGSPSIPLRNSDFAGGKEVTDTEPEYIYYYLKEVEAPTGYELLAEPFRFEIKSADVVSGTNTYTVQVADVKVGGGFTLPFTGGVGTTIFLIGGVLLLAGVGFKVVSYSRRTNKTAAN